MPRVSFAELPDSARVWVFASDRPLSLDESSTLLREVDAFLDQWKAHGAPLRNAREWRDEQFLVIGVDPTFEQASGCSIDGLFRSLQALSAQLGTSLVSGGRVFYRDDAGATHLAPRPRVRELVRADTPVFDTSLTSAGDYRTRFERPAAQSWLAPMLEQEPA